MKAIHVLQAPASASEGKKAPPELVWQTYTANAPETVRALGPDEVLVQVCATAVNRADLQQARGNYPPPPGASEILGLEAAGTVAEVGKAVRDFSPGDRVFALLSGGGYAEQVIVPADMLMRIPTAWSFETAAAVPEAWMTAYVNLFWEAQIAPGDWVLIHAGASGVGSAAIQLARNHGCRVAATAGTDEKLAVCRSLGAELAINYRTDSFADRIAAATGGSGVSAILDCVGGSYLPGNLQTLATHGRLVLIGLMGGNRAELDLQTLLTKEARIIGSRLRPKSAGEKSHLTEEFEQRIIPKLAAGELNPVITATFPIAEAGKAHEMMRANQNTGKIVLTVGH